jgi:hypothetical protein
MGKFILTQMAAIAELEAGLTSERTKAALATAKQRGVRLGVTGAERAKRYKAEAMARAVAGPTRFAAAGPVATRHRRRAHQAQSADNTGRRMAPPARGPRPSAHSGDLTVAFALCGSVPVIERIKAAGATSLRAIARALNARGIATARGGVWTQVQVTAVLRRAS